MSDAVSQPAARWAATLHSTMPSDGTRHLAGGRRIACTTNPPPGGRH